MHRTAAFIGISLLLGACASVQPISGGEQDADPPVLLATYPPNGSTGFNARAIRLEFNERIQLDRVRERFLISPPLDSLPHVRLAGPRSVEINLSGPLAPNTTYTFNLGESVKDLTEGNPATGLNYVVSTGIAVDSAVISGSVVNAFTGAAERDLIVGLYPAGDTSAFCHGRPSYMARTTASGLFTLANLPHGSFSMMALRDKNGNYRYDLPNEEIAFTSHIVTLVPADTATTYVAMRSFLPASTEQRIRSYSVNAAGALDLVLARAADRITVRDVARTGGSLTWMPEYNTTQDSVTLWPSDTALLVLGAYEISSGGHILDTLVYRPTKKPTFYTALRASLMQRPMGTFIEITASRPITTVDSTRMSLRIDSTAIPYSVTRTAPRRIELAFAPRYDMPVQLLIQPKAVRDIWGGYNDSLAANFGLATERSTGSLHVAMTGLEAGSLYLLQLLDDQLRVQQETVVSDTKPDFEWNLLVPGMRHLRLVQDNNGNGRWDTGEWSSLWQPERTWHHSDPVNVRAAWEVKVDWSIEAPR